MVTKLVTRLVTTLLLVTKVKHGTHMAGIVWRLERRLHGLCEREDSAATSWSCKYSRAGESAGNSWNISLTSVPSDCNKRQRNGQ